MNHSITVKFILIYICVLFLGFFAVAIVAYHIDTNKAREVAGEQMYEMANILSRQYALDYFTDTSTLTRMKKDVQMISDTSNYGIIFVNRAGVISYDTSWGVDDTHYILNNFDPTFGGAEKYTSGNFFNYFQTEQLMVLMPVSSNMTIRGYLLVYKDLDDIEVGMQKQYNTNYYTYLICMALAALFPLMAITEIQTPIRKIYRAVKEYGNGNLSYELQNFENDDLGKLASGLNYMATQLAETEETQRKFVANVSHDFRSPLTSIKGYLEAIMDGTIPPQMQNKYLGVVVAETERLSKLTNNLLTLNSMSSVKNRLNLEDFDVVAMTKNTVESFGGSCMEKKIQFDLTFCAKSVMVNADQEKMNQVLYNLIDNAIKFSHPESLIYISIKEKGDKVFVSVKDTGVGIPKDSVGKIWERFYKTDSSRGKDKKGSGLGLSIVKEIINLHQENIDVISTEGAGTEFTFSLAKAKYVSEE
ncbi:MAG: HAMP domain-containing histidine kinase [Lachnospiraceae bacterium]|nr:HAMP domain-containing histidine kinase [Lachnospiraceae bacterium]